MSYIQKINTPKDLSEVDFVGNPSIISEVPNQIWYSITKFNIFKDQLENYLTPIHQNILISIEEEKLKLTFPSKFSEKRITKIVLQIGELDSIIKLQNKYTTTTFLDQLNVNFIKKMLNNNNIQYQSIVYDMFSSIKI